jgi:hypothetical protein
LWRHLTEGEGERRRRGWQGKGRESAVGRGSAAIGKGARFDG